jgi:hypothetical protein
MNFGINHKETTIMNLSKHIITLSAIILGSFTYTQITLAQPIHLPPLDSLPPNQATEWTVEGYDDTSKIHRHIPPPIDLCFDYRGPSGTHDRYYWYLRIAPNLLNGIATQEGDQVFMQGTQYQHPFWIHSAQWEQTTESPISTSGVNEQGTGNWSIQTLTAPFIYGRYNVKFIRRIPNRCSLMSKTIPDQSQPLEGFIDLN